MEQSKINQIKKQLKLEDRTSEYKIIEIFYIKDFYIAEKIDSKNKTWYQMIKIKGNRVISFPSLFLFFYEALSVMVSLNKKVEYKK